MADDNPKAGSSSPRLQIVLALIAVSGVIAAAFIAKISSGPSVQSSPPSVQLNSTVNTNLPASPVVQATPAPPTADDVRRERLTQCMAGQKENLLTAADLQNALDFMASHGYINCVQWLLEYGAGINGIDSVFHEAPLHAALIQKQWEIAKLLIDKGADPNLYLEDPVGKTRRTPLRLATDRNAPEDVLKAIKAKGGNLE